MKEKRRDLQQINLNAAGIDIGSEFHYAAVPEDRTEKPVRKFGCYTSDLCQLTLWLKESNIDTVAMESTGVYWIPVYKMLESSGIEVILVNARHVKNVPGKKTDVVDSQWLQQLHTYGLLRGSYQPDALIRQLRTYMRQKDTLIKTKSSHVQRIQKCLIQMNIQLHKVLSDITGITGMKIIRSILAGERDPVKLAQMKNNYIKKSVETIAKALEGTYQSDQLFCLKQEVEQYDYLCTKIEECDGEIHKILDEMNDEKDDHGSMEKKITKKDIKAKLQRICHVDLTLIDGLDISGVETIISEVGIDMSKWPSEKHFGSWLGLSPSNKISGGQILGRKSKKVVNRAATAFRLAAFGAANSNSAIGAYYRRLKGRIGSPKAITATAYKIARMFYSCMKYKISYNDAGSNYYEEQYKDRLIKNLKNKAKTLGFNLVQMESV
jgi:transposase